MSGGAEAAQFIAEGVRKRIGSTTMNPKELTTLFTALDREMAAIGVFGETTCVVVVLSDSGVVGASVGDSGALIFFKCRC
jgi:hypothetical protein